MAFDDSTTFHLYTYFRSTSTARIRTAAHLKGLPLVYHYVSIPKGEHLETKYETINPNHTVPTLIVKSAKNPDFSITQSLAILEFLEESIPEKTPLLPPQSEVAARAHVRQLVNLVACDIQPPTNQRILKRVKGLGGSAENWARDIMKAGLFAFEALASPKAQEYCYGHKVTMADIVLAPAVVNAVRYGVDLNDIPTIKRVYETIMTLEAFKQGDWRHQEDTPPEFRDT